MRSFQEYLAQARAKLGEKFDPSELAPQFWPYLESGETVRVSVRGKERSGTIKLEGKYKPVLILRYTSTGYWTFELLGKADQVLAVKRGRKYEKVTERTK